MLDKSKNLIRSFKNRQILKNYSIITLITHFKKLTNYTKLSIILIK